MSTNFVLAAEKVNLRGSWDTFWASIQADGTFIGMKSLMMLVGMLIVVAAIGKWLWAKNKPGGQAGRGGSQSTVVWALACGVLIAAPNLILPPVLSVLDTVANGVLGIFNSTQTNPGTPAPKGTPPTTGVPPAAGK